VCIYQYLGCLATMSLTNWPSDSIWWQGIPKGDEGSFSLANNKSSYSGSNKREARYPASGDRTGRNSLLSALWPFPASMNMDHRAGASTEGGLTSLSAVDQARNTSGYARMNTERSTGSQHSEMSINGLEETEVASLLHGSGSSSGWHGAHTHKHHGGKRYTQLKNPLLGVEVGFNEAQELAQEVDNMRTQGHIKLLNFAYISLEKKAALLGSGSYSKVYKGQYKGQRVAVKMLHTPDLNPDVIRRCSNEVSWA
jgi:hypothetical protein